MARLNVAQFLDRIAVDDALRDELVELGAERGFRFTKEELTEAEPGATAEPLTWRNLAQFPDLTALSAATETSVATHPRKTAWPNKTSLLAATSVLLYGSLTWYLWRHRRTAT